MKEKFESVFSERGFQDSQLSASSNIRRKVDVLNVRENGDSKKQVLPNSKCNLRMSLAWDSAFFTSPGVLEPEELFTTLNSRNYDNVVNILGNEEHLLFSSQSLEPDTISKAENYNYRKSLAWDNGFFTSEGVLNPFELAIVNNGFKKSERHLLPVVENEVWRSMESNSTLDSEGSSLTRLEMDLFEDIRASIPKPITSRFELGRTASAEKDDSRTMTKAMSSCRRHSINKHGSKKITRDMSNTPKIPLKHMGESKEHYSDKTNSVSRGSTRRASLGEKHVKLGCRSRILTSAEGLGKLRKPCLRESTQSLRSSMLHSSSQTTSNVSSRLPSEMTIGKSPPNLRRKGNSQGSNALVARPASMTPLMKTKANKAEVESSCQTTPTSSWYGSPSSSIDEWPSESSSVSATQGSNRRKHSPYSSLRSSLIKIKNQESQVRYETSVNQQHRKDHKGDGNIDASSSVLREVKPSGLRMPSPKLGFFDPENMLVDAKRDVVHRSIRCTKLQSSRALPGTEIRNRKNGGTPVPVSGTKSNRSPTVRSHNKNVQCCSNRSMKVAQYPELDFQISHDDNKENQISLMNHQVESLVKQVNSIDLKGKVVNLN